LHCQQKELEHKGGQRHAGYVAAVVGERHISGQNDVEYSKGIKPVALSIVELCLAELGSQCIENSKVM